MSNPSPLPWSINRFGGLIDATEYRIPVSGTVPAPTAEDGATGDANAALIVQAVNSHADLLAACRAALAFFEEKWPEMDFGIPEQIRSAVRKAEGDA
jgi:hypothetical protein